MDEENGCQHGEGASPGENHIVDCPNRWAGFGSLLGCLVSCVACSVVPDRVGIGAGHTFNRGSHLETTARESGSGLRDRDIGDEQNIFAYVEYDIGPPPPTTTQFSLADRELLRAIAYGPRRGVEITVTKPAEQEPTKTEPTPPNDEQDPSPDPVQGQIENVRQALEVVGDSSWDTFWKASGYTALGLSALGGWWLFKRRKKRAPRKKKK